MISILKQVFKHQHKICRLNLKHEITNKKYVYITLFKAPRSVRIRDTPALHEIQMQIIIVLFNSNNSKYIRHVMFLMAREK